MSGIHANYFWQFVGLSFSVGLFWLAVFGGCVYCHMKTGGAGNPKRYTPKWLKRLMARERLQRTLSKGDRSC